MSEEQRPYYDPSKQEYVYDTSDVEPLVGTGRTVSSSNQEESYYIASIVLLVLGFFFTGILWLVNGIVFQNRKYGARTRTIARISLIFFFIQCAVVGVVFCGSFIVWIIAMIAAGVTPVVPVPVVPSASISPLLSTFL